MVTEPLPNAQVVPLKVTETSKMFFPLARGVAVPVAPHPPDTGTEIAPVGDMVTGVDCAEVLPVTPVPE